MDMQAETYADHMLGFTLPGRNARARVVRLEGVIQEILSAHDYPAPVTHLVGEALVLASLMGGLLKAEGDDAQLTLQAQTQSGVVSLLVCDYRGGQLRGYADFDEERLSKLGANPSLSALFGEGYLAITFETAKGGRYQGIVPLEGDTLAQACEAYFSQSEQVPTMIRIASRAGGAGRLAAGLLIQHLPDGEEGRERLHVRMDHPDWEHVATMTSTISHAELLDRDLSLEALVWRLFHEESEIRVQSAVPIRRGCRCSPEYYASVIARFPAEEQAQMRDEDGRIVVDCAFCARKFELEVWRFAAVQQRLIVFWQNLQAILVVLPEDEYMTERKHLVGAIAALGLLGFGLSVQAAAQSDSLAMLGGLTKGEWTIKHRDGSEDRKICVKTGQELIQLRHSDSGCSRFVVEDGANKVTVQYTCPGNGYGRTNIRKETGSLVQIESQGIASGLPFQFAAEARRTGTC